MYTPHRVNVMIKASPYIQRQCVLGVNACTFEQNRGSMPTLKGLLKLVSEYDQEIPQSQTADNPPIAPRRRATQASVTRVGAITESQFVMNLGEDYLGPVFGIINDQSLRLFVKMHSMIDCDKKKIRTVMWPSWLIYNLYRKGEQRRFKPPYMYIPVCAVSIEPSLHSYKHYSNR